MRRCVTFPTLALLLLLAGSVLAQTEDDICDYCVENATCSGNGTTCECNAGYEGDGTLHCFKSGERDVCAVCDDPVMTTLSDDSVKLNALGEVLLCDDTEKKGGNILTLEAYLKLIRQNGKVYADYLRIVFKSLPMFVGRKCNVVFKIAGERDVNTGKVKFDISIETAPGVFMKKATLNDAGMLKYSATHCGCEFKFEYAKGGLLNLDIVGCDITFAFRPRLGKIKPKSGLYISKPKKENPEDTPLPDPLKIPVCLRPGLAIKTIQESLGLSTPRDAMSFIALTNLPQTVLDTLPAQANLSDVLLNCNSQLPTFFDNSNFMLESHPFIHCISGPGTGFENILSVLWRTSEYFCLGKLNQCESVVGEILTKCGHLLEQPDPRHEEIKNFLALCPVNA